MANKRVKICFQCKQYIIIYSDDPVNMKFENVFSMVHSGHMVQVVNLSEVEGDEYMQVYNSGEEMEKLAKEVQDDLSYIDGVGRSW